MQNPPYTNFYLSGIAGIDQESEHRFANPFVKLDPSQKREVIEAAAKSSTEVWRDPNPNFFYFVSRSDAVDVVYGTMAGFRNLNIPYLAHIAPDEPW